MKLIQRHIFYSIFITSLTAVGLFVFILLTGNALKDIFREALAGRLTAGTIARLLGLLIPYVVAYALPLGVLTATLVVLGRLSARNEIVALKAAGFSLWSISTPIFLTALFAVAVSIGINGYYAPQAKAQYRELLANLVRDDPLTFITPGTFIDQFPGHVIYADSKEGDILKDFWIWRMDAKGNVINLLRANKGWFSYDEAENEFMLNLEDGFSELRSKEEPDNVQSLSPSVKFREAAIHLSMNNVLGKRRQYRKLSTMTLNELMAQSAQLQDEIDALPENSDADERYRLRQKKTRTQTQMQKQIAFSFSTLVLTLVGIPLSIRVGRKETYTNAALALGLGLGYNFLMILFSWLEKMPEWRPDLLIWLPNILFLELGLFLFIRANQN